MQCYAYIILVKQSIYSTSKSELVELQLFKSRDCKNVSPYSVGSPKDIVTVTDPKNKIQ